MRPLRTDMNKKVIRLTEHDIMRISMATALKMMVNEGLIREKEGADGKRHYEIIREGRFTNGLKRAGKSLADWGLAAGTAAALGYTALNSDDPYWNSEVNPTEAEARELQRDVLDQNAFDDAHKNDTATWGGDDYYDEDEKYYNESVIARAVNESLKKHLKKKRKCGGKSCCKA